MRISAESSPRSWGCFHGLTVLEFWRVVFPTLVGVFPCPASPMWRCTSLPHARGGVSHAEARAFQPDTSSPRSWGCFLL